MNDNQLAGTRIGFIGAGNMASSLIGGLIKQGVDSQLIAASDASHETCDRIKQAFGVETFPDNQSLVSFADVIVLAVKPQVMKQVTIELSTSVCEQRPLMVSIAAGITINMLQKWLGESTALIRCMPNTPALVQQGATAMYANQHVSDAQKKLATSILDSVGMSLWVDNEDMIDAVTAVSGSGPAYYFYLMEAMIKAGIELGLDEATASKLTLQTAQGAAVMAIAADKDNTDTPAGLRSKVTSPNGTTEQAIQSFQNDSFEAMVMTALKAARDRSITLSKELDD